MHTTEKEALNVTQPIVREPARRDGIIAKLAANYEMDEASFAKTLVATVFPDGKGTREQVAALCLVASEYGLNPFTKQIYAFPGKGGGIIPVISVDGWYAIANRQPQFDGIEFQYIEDAKGEPVACTATVHRKDRAHPTVVTEYISECKRNTPPWNTQKRRMIRHRAAIQGIRIAFGISAIDPDEAERIPEYEVEAGVEPVAAVASINAKLTGGSVVVTDSDGCELEVMGAQADDARRGHDSDTSIGMTQPPPAEVPSEEAPKGALFDEGEGPSAFEL